MRGALVAASAIVVALVPVSTGHASSHPVTVGQTQSANEACSADANNLVQTSNAGGASYAVPYTGVLTSWSHSARQIQGAQLQLKVFRHVGGIKYMTVGQSGFQSVQDPQDYTFPVRIPVQAGDLLGLGLADNRATNPTSCFFRTNEGGDSHRERVGDVPPNQSEDFPIAGNEIRLNVSARLEAAPPGPNPNPFTPLVDRRKPKGKVTKANGNSVLTNGVVALTVTPDEDGTLAGGATVNVPPLSKVYRFKSTSKTVRAGVKTRVKLKLSKKGLRAARRAARARKKLKVKVSLTLTDRAGNKAAVKRTIRVTKKKKKKRR